MVRSLWGHFFAPGKHRLRAWTWLRASMSSQCQTILQQCSAHLQLEVVLIALKNACSGTKFVESSQSSLNYMYGAVTRKLLLRCARSHLYVHRPSHCFGCFKSHVNLSKSSHIDGTAFASYCIRSSFFMFTTIHYWSWYTDIHNIQQPKLCKEAGLGSKICTILMDTGECSLFSGSLFCSMFVPQGIYKRHPTAWKTLEISDTSCHSCHSSDRIVASNRRLQSSSSFAAGGGRTLSAWNHGVVLHLSKGLPHLGTSTFRSLAKGLLERPGAAPLAALFKGPPFLQNFRSQQRIWRDHNWTSAWHTMIRSYQIVTSFPSGSTRKNVLKDGTQSLLILETPERTSCLCTEPNSTGIGWLTSVGHPGKMFRLIWSSQLQRQNAGNLQAFRESAKYIHMCIYIYIYVWGSGLVKQESQEMSKHLHNMEPPSCKLVYKPHQL